MTSEFLAFLTAHVAKAREASSKSGPDILIKEERERDLLNLRYKSTKTQTEGEFFFVRGCHEREINSVAQR